MKKWKAFLVKPLLMVLATMKHVYSAEWICSPSTIGTQTITLKKTWGVMQSPNYPKAYPNNIDCVWKITVPSGKRIKLTFSHMDLQNKLSCTSDYVELRSGLSLRSRRIGRYCGSSLPSTQYSSGRYLLVKFHSDRSVTGTGFNAKYQAIDSSNNTSTSGSSSGSIGGAVAGIFFLIMFFIFITRCYHRRWRPAMAVATPAAQSTVVVASNVNVNQQQVSAPVPPHQQQYPQAIAKPPYYPAGYPASPPNGSAYPPTPQGSAFPPTSQFSAYPPHSQVPVDLPPPYESSYPPTHQESSYSLPHQGSSYPPPNQGTPYPTPSAPPPGQGIPPAPYDYSAIPPKQ